MSALGVRTVLQSLVSTAYKNVRFKNTYKAAILERVGKSLEIKEIEREKLESHEIRVQVSYCTINSYDVQRFRSETLAVPFVPGYELSGEIVEMGSDASKEFLMGEKVAALTLENYGGVAEEVVVDMNETFRVPPNLTLKDAAVIIYGHSLALYTFGKLSNIKKDDNVIVTVGAGGMGLAGVDVAANIYKSKVIAVTETEVQSELTREKGAFQTLHYNKDLKKEVMKLLSDKGVDIAYNSVSAELLDVVSTCIRDKGALFNASPFVGTMIPSPPPHVSFTNVSLSTLREHDVEAYRQIVCDALEMADEGIITAHISESFDLEDVNKAIEFIDSKKCTGKVIVKMD